MTINDMCTSELLQFGVFSPQDPITGHSESPHDIKWKKVSKEGDFISYHTETGLRFDHCEYNNPNQHRAANGNNFYPQSNIHQYLNSSSPSFWYSPTHEYDNVYPPSESYPGFLSSFEQWELDMLVQRTIECVVPSGSRKLFGNTATITCKVSLPSLSEILGDQNSPVLAEGEQFTNLNYMPEPPSRGSQLSYTERYSRIYLTRTADVKSDCYSYAFDGLSRTFIRVKPSRTYGVRPVIRLPLDAELQFVPEGEGYYIVNPPKDAIISEEDLTKILTNF